MNENYIQEMIRSIIGTTGVTVDLDHRLCEALTIFWQDYAVGIIDLDTIKEIAQNEHIPMSLAEAREILYQLEENGDITYDGATAVVDDWAENFDWENPSVPIPYDEFTWNTCNWMIVAETNKKKILIEAIPYHFVLGHVILRAAKFAAHSDLKNVKRWLVVVTETNETVFDSSKNWHAGFGTPRLGEDQAVCDE